MSLNWPMPWWFKVGVKLAVGCLPVRYEQLRNSVTGHYGGMEDISYATKVFSKFERLLSAHEFPCAGSAALELGPGGSLLSGIFCRALGFDKCFLVDVGNFAVSDPKVYSKFLGLLSPLDQEIFRSCFSETNDVLESFSRIGIYYHTQGISSLKSMETNSIEFSFSNAVVEHILLDEFGIVCEELSRLHGHGSISCHQIDYKDHIGGGLNNLRFPHWLWESPYFPNAGFYTNRLRHFEVLNALVSSGFTVIEEDNQSWETLPLTRKALAKNFASMYEKDLLVKGSFLVVRRC